MRTGRNNVIDEEPSDTQFRQLLGRYGEPHPPSLPPDLVTRSMRQIPDVLPADLLGRARIARAIALIIAVAAVAAALAGAWALRDPRLAAGVMAGGDGTAGRALLTLQLAAKPILGAVSSLGLALLCVGVAAAIGSAAIVRRVERATQGA